MKFILFLWIITFNSIAFVSDDSKQYIARLKAQEIEDHILSSENYKQCYEKIKQADPTLSSEDIQDEVRACLSSEIQNADEAEIEKLSGSLKIKDVNTSGAKTIDSLKDYLQERIHDAIHGEGSYKKNQLKELKFVDQKQYFTIYEAQIHKNITLELSKYCLENLGTKNGPENFLDLAASAAAVGEINRKMQAGEVVGIDEITLYNEHNLANYDSSEKEYKMIDFTDAANPILTSNIYDKTDTAKKFGKVIKEYTFCPKLNFTDVKDPCYYTNARDAKLISQLKKYELHKAQSNPQKLAQRFILCSKIIVRNMCEVYRCNNTYDWAAASNTELGKKVKYCKDELGVSPPTTTVTDPNAIDLKDKDPNGKIACNLMTRLNDYKKTLDKIDVIKKDLRDNFKVASGLNVGTTFKSGLYQLGQGKGEKKIDEITSIASKELIEKVDQFKKNDELAQELKTKCILPDGTVNTSDPSCEGLTLSDDEIGNLKAASLQAEAETQAYLKRLEELKGKNDTDSLKKFLKEQGMENYIDKIGQLGDDELIDLLKSKYKSDRQAVISSMNDRLYDIINKNDTQQINNIVVSDKIEEIDDNKERVETLFNYTNIVSSYVQLSGTDSSGAQTQRGNDAARNLEAQGMDNYGSEDEKAQYQSFFVDDADSNAGSSDSNNFYSTSSLINDIGDFATAE